MKIFTVVRTEETWTRPASTDIEGSFVRFDSAVEKAVDRIMELIQKRSDMAFAIGHDEDHPDIVEELEKSNVSKNDVVSFFERECEEMSIPKEMYDVVRKFVRDEILGTRCYYMCVACGDQEEFHFEIIENDLEEK